MAGSRQAPAACRPGPKVESDRVNANKFYGFYNGTFYVSTNGGQSLHGDGRYRAADRSAGFKPMTGIEGDIWLAGATGLYRSTNSGTSFTKIWPP